MPSNWTGHIKACIEKHNLKDDKSAEVQKTATFVGICYHSLGSYGYKYMKIGRRNYLTAWQTPVSVRT